MKFRKLTAFLLVMILVLSSAAPVLAAVLEDSAGLSLVLTANEIEALTDAINPNAVDQAAQQESESDTDVVTAEETENAEDKLTLVLDPSDAMTGTVTVDADGTVKIDGKTVADKVLEEARSSTMVTFGPGDIAETIGKTFVTTLFSTIFRKITSKDYSNAIANIQKGLTEMSGKLDKISAQIDQATKEILGAIERKSMTDTLREISQDANSIKTKYYDLLPNRLKAVADFSEGKLTNEADTQRIDDSLHAIYCYYKDETTSPVTGFNYTTTYGDSFYNDFIILGNQLSGELPLGLINRDIFQLYYGINVYSCNFNSETTEIREKMNKAAFDFYEQGYAALNMALLYDRVNHQNLMYQDAAAIALLKSSLGTGQWTDAQKTAIDQTIKTAGGDQYKHQRAVEDDTTRSATLNDQYKAIKDKREAADAKVTADKNENHNGTVTCYRSGKQYKGTLYVGSVNWGLDNAVSGNNIRYYIVTKMSGHNPETWIATNDLEEPYRNEDRVRKDTKFGRAASMSDLDSLKTWASDRGMTLDEELKLSFNYSVNEDLSDAKAYKDCTNSKGIYLSGWQWTKEESSGGCGKQPYQSFNRTVKLLQGNNVTETCTIRKKWWGGGTYDKETKLLENTNSNDSMTILLNN